MEETIVNASKLKKYFPIKEGILSSTKEYIKAVDNVDIQIRKGETFGLVGESGCGKTTLGHILIHLIPPTAGTLLFMGSNLTTIKKSELLKLRAHIKSCSRTPPHPSTHA